MLAPYEFLVMTTMPIDKHAENSIWVAMPSLNCVLYISEEMAFGGFTKQCIVNQVFFANLLVHLEKSRVGLDAELEKQLQQITRMNAELGMQAANEAMGGYTKVNVHTVVNMWNYIYSGIQDTASVILLHDLDARSKVLAILGQKVFPLEPEDFDLAFLAQRYLGKFLKTQFAQVAFPNAFAGLDLVIDTSKQDFSLLEEIRCVRNCIVHNSGFIDDYARQRVPGLLCDTGAAIKITEENTKNYLLHMSNFVSALSEAALASKYCPMKSR